MKGFITSVPLQGSELRLYVYVYTQCLYTHVTHTHVHSKTHTPTHSHVSYIHIHLPVYLCISLSISTFVSMCYFCCLVAQSCPTHLGPLGLGPINSGSAVHGISHGGILEWVTISFSRGFSWPRDWTCLLPVFWIAGEFFTTEPPELPMYLCLSIYIYIYIQFSSVQSLSHIRLFWPHGLQHARPPCPSPTPRV